MRTTTWVRAIGKPMTALILAAATLLTGLTADSLAKADDPTPTGNDGTTGLVLQWDGQPHDVTAGPEKGTNLDGVTIDYRTIATLRKDGTLQAATPAAAQAAAKAGGQGDNPTDDLLRRIATHRAWTNTTAPIIWDAIHQDEPAATQTGAGTTSLAEGWYLATTPQTGRDQAQLVYAGNYQSDTALMMLDGAVTLPGNPGDTADDAPAITPYSWDAWVYWSWEYDTPWDTNGDDVRGGNANFIWSNSPTGARYAYCLDPGAWQGPEKGATYDRTPIMDNRLRAILYYGYGGPASIYDDGIAWEVKYGKHAGGAPNEQRFATHLALAAFYQGRDPQNPNWVDLPNDWVRNLTGYQDLVDIGYNHPLSTDVSLNAWLLDLHNGHQRLISSTFTPTRIEADTQIATDRNAISTNRTTPLVDTVRITPKALGGADQTYWSGWPAGEHLKVCSKLLYNSRDDATSAGHSERSVTKCVDAKPDTDVKRDTWFTVPNPPQFKPFDLGMDEWQDGLYWFDTYFDSHQVNGDISQPGGPIWAPFVNFAYDVGYWWIYAKNDPQKDEELRLTGTPDLTFATVAQTGQATIGGTQPVYDRITVTNNGKTDVEVKGLEARLGNAVVCNSNSEENPAKADVPRFTVKAGQTVTVESNDLRDSTADGYDNCYTASWGSGRYWVDIYASEGMRITNPDDGTLLKVYARDTLLVSGKDDPAEQFTLEPGKVSVRLAAEKMWTFPNGITDADVPWAWQVQASLYPNMDATGTPIQTKTLAKGDDGKGHALFQLDYGPDDIGTHNYSIKETVPGGQAPSSETYRYIVRVTQDAEGNLTANVSNLDNATAVFHNTYKTPADVRIEAVKTWALEGDVPQDATVDMAPFDPYKGFTANLYRADDNGRPTGQPIQSLPFTKGADGKGHAKFDPIGYAKAGTYRYAVTETSNIDSPLVTMDATIRRITVQVTDTGGNLDAQVVKDSTSEGATVTFTNRFIMNPTEYQFKATKTYAPTTPTTPIGSFRFQLHEGADGKGKVIQTVTPAADGTISFTPIKRNWDSMVNDDGTPTATKTFDYSVTEIDDGRPGIDYDHHVAVYHVTITAGLDGLTSTVSQGVGTSAPDFHNAWNPKAEIVLSGRKAWDQAEADATGVDADAFTFQLLNEQGKVIQQTHPGPDGTITWNAIRYTIDQLDGQDMRQFRYTMREKTDTPIEGVHYDTHVATITVTVTSRNGMMDAHADVEGGDGQLTFDNTTDRTGTMPSSGQAGTAILAAATILLLGLAATILLRHGRTRPDAATGDRTDGGAGPDGPTVEETGNGGEDPTPEGEGTVKEGESAPARP